MSNPLTTAPRLTTDRLILRGPRADDLPALERFYATSPRMTGLGGNRTPEQARFAFQTNIGRWQMDGMGFFTVVAQVDPTPLGRVGLLYYPISDVRDAPEVEAAWHLFDGAEGRGIAFEAAQAVLHWARDNLGWHRVVSYIAPHNAPSQALARRLGASPDGTQAAHNAEADVWVHEEAA